MTPTETAPPAKGGAAMNRNYQKIAANWLSGRTSNTPEAVKSLAALLRRTARPNPLSLEKAIVIVEQDEWITGIPPGYVAPNWKHKPRKKVRPATPGSERE